jgi:hypothetical protein
MHKVGDSYDSFPLKVTSIPLPTPVWLRWDRCALANCKDDNTMEKNYDEKIFAGKAV